ncbi:MAG TPA: LCP family protein [Candidatus Limnocylindrales bacterium]|jgi:LCP family protein required for cell wall assembly|nr:LCP family protein [Candidatus Limnocylindrales bacterium]
MPPAHESLPRGRSPFAAAFLSLLFPGLGHAYLGAYRRGLGFAAPPLLAGALVAGFAVRMNAVQLAGLAIQSWFLIFVFVANLVALVYRAVAIFDAWSIARMVSGGSGVAGVPGAASASVAGAGAGPGNGSTARQAGIVSIAGLAAVLLVMSGIHVAVARYDVLFATTANCIFDPSQAACAPPEGTPGPGDDGSAAPSDDANPSDEATDAPGETAVPIPPWNGTDRLNILLIGADEQNGGHNTDTMITVSIDPQSGQVVMFTLPRDTVDVPVPPGSARNVFGSLYSGKINSFFVAARASNSAFPGPRDQRGYTGLKAILGNLYGLDIKYYVEVNFDGFRQVVDALGGVTVNVQVPVLDDNFPQPGGHRERLFVPAGMQHMTGAEALEYARSRKSTSDFERGARQQRIIVSLRQQMDIASVLKNINPLAAAIGQSVRTDIPRELVPQLLGLADKVDTRSIRSVIFTPPFYQTECLNCPPRGYIISPKVDRIRQAVADAFKIDPAFAEKRDALTQEGAEIWVLNGSGTTGEAARTAEYLSYLGMAATAPIQKPDVTKPPTTILRAYNGAEANFPLTLAALQDVFGVTVVTVTDPNVRIDFEVITGGNTPELTPPPAP